MVYTSKIRRCQHIKVNGTQCRSPALRDQQCCYFHTRWRHMNTNILAHGNETGPVTLPTLEDANSIQVGLAEVMRLLVTSLIDHRTAALLLQALRTAALNVKLTTLEPTLPTTVVVDQECVDRRPIGATAWSKVAGRDFDDVADQGQKEMKDDCNISNSFLWFLIDRRLALDPEFLDKWVGTNRGEMGKELAEN